MASGKVKKEKDKKTNDAAAAAAEPFPSQPPPVTPQVMQPSMQPVSDPDFLATLDGPEVRYPEPPEEKLHYDEIDVPFALARVTQDGRGENPPGPSDFVAYADPHAVREAGT